MQTTGIVKDRDLRLFGDGVGLVLALIALWLFWRGGTEGAAALLVAAILLSVACRARWPGTRWLFRRWHALALLLERISSTLVLCSLYYGALTPLALLARACGQRFLVKGFRSGEQSCWQHRKPHDGEDNLKKQY